jgi:hypothetical protein
MRLGGLVLPNSSSYLSYSLSLTGLSFPLHSGDLQYANKKKKYANIKYKKYYKLNSSKNQ